ncbi:MAG: site-specific integrase [Anaerolineales bacterium]|nr:site-specific integrase [Anaerolineales bacterium]
MPVLPENPTPNPDRILQSGDSLSAAIAVWEQSLKEAGNTPNTVNAFTADLRLMMRYLGGGRALSGVSTRDLQDFFHWMETERGVPCSPKTYSRRITSVKSFFRRMLETGVLAADPAVPIVQRLVQSPLPEILTYAEARRVLAAARAMRSAPGPAILRGRGGSKTDPNRRPPPGKPLADDRPFTLVSLLLQTGIKKGECTGLRMNHIDSGAGEPCLFIRYGNPRQRFKERKIALSREWVESYARYLEQYAPTDRVFPWSPRRLEYLLEEIGARAGLEKHLSFDMCRWTCAVLDRKRGLEPDKVRQKLGLSRMQWREVGKKIEQLTSAAGETAASDVLYSLSMEDGA